LKFYGCRQSARQHDNLLSLGETGARHGLAGRAALSDDEFVLRHGSAYIEWHCLPPLRLRLRRLAPPSIAIHAFHRLGIRGVARISASGRVALCLPTFASLVQDDILSLEPALPVNPQLEQATMRRLLRFQMLARHSSVVVRPNV